MSLEATIKAAREYLAPDKVDCVVYHHPCNDGTGAALAAWVARGEEIEYLPLDYTKPFVEQQLLNKNVLVIDASFKKEQLQHIRNIAKKVLILDHHESAMKDLAGEPGCCFTMGNSGAVLAWHYFHGVDTPPPTLLRLIQDRDLWAWQERELSEPLFYALVDWYTTPDFRQYAQYLQSEALDKLIAHGKGLVAENHRWCVEVGSGVVLKYFVLPGMDKKYHIASLEVANDKLISELSEYLYTKHDIDFVMLWHKLPGETQKYKISFRNNKPTVNVAEIAAALGGGGHARAAGVSVSCSPVEFLV